MSAGKEPATASNPGSCMGTVGLLLQTRALKGEQGAGG